MGSIGCVRCEKFRCKFMAQTCALIAPVQPVLHRVDKCTQTLEKTLQNMSLGSNGVDPMRSLPKIPMRVRGNSSAYFALCFMLQNNPKCTQTLQNAPIHEFSVQWGGSGAFIAKNSDAISWHELL